MDFIELVYESREGVKYIQCIHYLVSEHLAFPRGKTTL